MSKEIARANVMNRGKDAFVAYNVSGDCISPLTGEHLEMGFVDGIIDKDHVRPLIPGLDPYESRWLTDEKDISEALEYMIDFLRSRQDAIYEYSIF